MIINLNSMSMKSEIEEQISQAKLINEMLIYLASYLNDCKKL